MHSTNRSIRTTRWFGFFLGLFVCNLPLVAMAAEFKAPRRGIPGRREGGGTRDASVCVQGNSGRLTAIMPETNLGLTTAEYPRFFWYMPKTRATYAEFSLYKTNDQLENQVAVYTTIFKISGTSGVASLTIPANSTLPPLEIGKDYRWSIALICNPNDRKRDIAADGWVQRVKPDARLISKLSKANGSDRVTLYADNGIWFETITTLAELRCSDPQNRALAANWVELLKSVKLNAIAEQPLVQHCED